MTSIHLQCLLGIQCKDFVIIAADQTNTQSIIIMKSDENKLYEVTDKLMIGVIGDMGDCGQFAQFVAKNVDLYKMRNRYRLNTAASVHFARKNMADSLRGGTPAMINMLIAGFENDVGGELYAVDFLASCVKVPFAVHGFGGQLALSILHEYYNPNMTERQAYEILKLCVREIHKRLFISLPNFQVKSVSKIGIKHLPIISPAALI